MSPPHLHLVQILQQPQRAVRHGHGPAELAGLRAVVHLVVYSGLSHRAGRPSCSQCGPSWARAADSPPSSSPAPSSSFLDGQRPWGKISKHGEELPQNRPSFKLARRNKGGEITPEKHRCQPAVNKGNTQTTEKITVVVILINNNSKAFPY